MIVLEVCGLDMMVLETYTSFCVNLAKKCETMGVKFRYDTRIDWYQKACRVKS